MEVQVRTYEDAMITPLEGGQAFEVAPGFFDVLAEVASRAPWSVEGVKAIVIGKDELARIVAMDQLVVGTLAGGERRPIRCTLRALGDLPVINIYLHVTFDEVTPVEGILPSGMLTF